MPYEINRAMVAWKEILCCSIKNPTNKNSFLKKKLLYLKY
jgi:hypothetical protein